MSARLAALLAAAALAACCAQGAFVLDGSPKPLCPPALPGEWLARVESAQGTAYVTADGAFLFCRAPGKP